MYMPDRNELNTAEGVSEDKINVTPEEITSPQQKARPPLEIWAGISLLVLLLIGGVGWYIFSSKVPAEDSNRISEVVGVDLSSALLQGTFDYTIPGVPYIGVYNHIGELSYINSDTDAAITSVVEYWHSGENNIKELADEIRTKSISGTLTLRNIADYVKSYGDYVAEQKYIDVTELKTYINSELKTPLLFLMPFNGEQPAEAPYIPLSVLIGVNEPAQKLTIHSYWLGNNYEVSFSDFRALQERLSASQRNAYVIIQPKSLIATLENISNRSQVAYPLRGKIMEKSSDMLKNYAVGLSAHFGRFFTMAESYFRRTIDAPDFETSMPPYFKVMVLHKLAATELALNKNDAAMTHALKAVELNHDLEAVFGDWPGYRTQTGVSETPPDRISGPYTVLGDIYKKSGSLSKAKEAYQEALKINPNDTSALLSLEFIEKHLAFLDANVSSGISNEALTKTLIQGSSWSVSWKNSFGNSGTQTINFFLNPKNSLEGTVKSSETRFGDMKNIAFQNGCVSFVFSVSETKYKYCLTQAGTLEGIYSGFDTKNIFFLGSAIAQPSKN